MPQPGRPTVVGHRPEAWWRFEAERPSSLTGYPDKRDSYWDVEVDSRTRTMSDESRERYERHWFDYGHEPILWLAEHDDLTEDEIAKIEQEAEEAQERIDAGDERVSSGFLHCDQAAVELARRVQAARGRRN
jgi:hypothetical protein